MMSIRTVNALSHYTDWTIGHVHSGALGWVAMITFGSLYYLIPRLYGRTTMHSVKAIELHFWVATIGVVLYIAAMRSEEHTSELQSLMRISYAVFCLKKKTT